MTKTNQAASGMKFWANRTPAERALIWFVVGYVALFFYLAKRSLDNFGRETGDVAIYTNLMWHMAQGHWFYICPGWGESFFRYHAEFFWLFLTPFFKLFPSASTLLFLQTLSTGLAAWPVFLIARRLLANETAAALLGAAFTLLPPIVSQNVNQIHNGPFVLVPILFTYYFFIERRFGWFMLFCLLSCLNRENQALAVCMFGIWAIAERRNWKWAVSPVVFGIFYFWFTTRVVMLPSQGAKEWHVVGYFSYLGATPSEILHNALTKPSLIINHLLGSENIFFFVMLVQPLGWVLPFAHWSVLVGLPDGAGNLLSDNSALKVIAWHYNILTGTALFVSTLFSVKRLGGWLEKKYGSSGGPTIVIAAGLLALSIAHWFLWFQPQQFRRLPYHDTMVRALAAVPPDKSLIAPLRLQGNIAARPHYHNIGLFDVYPAGAVEFEYVLLDANERQYLPTITQEFFDKFNKDPNYHLIFAENNVFVFQRLGGESDWKAPGI